MTGGEAEEKIVPLEVASGAERYGAESARSHGVGWVKIVEQLHVRTELKLELLVVGRCDAGDEGGRA